MLAVIISTPSASSVYHIVKNFHILWREITVIHIIITKIGLNHKGCVLCR